MNRYYSRFVGVSKYGLWCAVLALVATIVWVVIVNTDDSGARLVITSMSSQENASPAMMNPRYQGVDEHNRPFTVTAVQATQLDTDRVHIQNIAADLTMESGNWVAMTAGEGIYNSAKKMLDLTQGVTMYYEGGFEMRSSTALVDLGHGEVAGTTPIEGQGTLGELHALRWQVLDRGQRLLFNDNVAVRLYPKAKTK